MTTEEVTVKDTAQRGEKTGRYAASWIDHLADWVGRLPGQSWLYYLGSAFVLTLAQALMLWLEGAFDTGVLPVLGFLTGMIAFFFMLGHYLSRRVGTFIYHTVHQLRELYRIYTDHTQIRLLRQGPLYAFSGVAALSAIGLTIPPYGFAVLAAIPLTDPILLAFILPITGLALAAFVWPMLGAHRLLVKEKQRMLDEAGLRLEAAIVDLHRRMDDRDLEEMDSLNSAMANLELEREALKGIPTWPWQPETARILATAVLLPLGLWLVQYVLQAVMER